ncbi:MAG: hypothetical protein GEU95_12105 [Rhizobiales bacterium]|nr:hypothetical protein [Hyphomicrobiales bacterium]
MSFRIARYVGLLASTLANAMKPKNSPPSTRRQASPSDHRQHRIDQVRIGKLSEPPRELSLDGVILDAIGELAEIGDAERCLRGDAQVETGFNQRAVARRRHAGDAEADGSCENFAGRARRTAPSKRPCVGPSERPTCPDALGEEGNLPNAAWLLHPIA